MKSVTPTMPSQRDLKTQVSRQLAPRSSKRSPKTLVSGQGTRKAWYGKLAMPFFAFSLALFVVAVGLLARARLAKPAASTPAVTADAPLAVGEATVTTSLFFRATPADAALFLDGEALPDNPARVTRTRDGKAHKARAIAPGYSPKEVSVAFDGASVQVDLALESLPTSAASVSSAVVERPLRKQASAAPEPPAPTPIPSAGHRPAKVIIDPTDPWQR